MIDVNYSKVQKRSSDKPYKFNLQDIDPNLATNKIQNFKVPYNNLISIIQDLLTDPWSNYFVYLYLASICNFYVDCEWTLLIVKCFIDLM